MSKVGIVAYILGFIFIVFCFWIVGCSSDSTDGCLDPGPASANYTMDSSFTCNDGVYEYRD
jgi:hypothetical protein